MVEMKHKHEMNAMVHNSLGGFSQKCCDIYWEILRHYLCDKEQCDQTLEEQLKDIFEEYT
jgi:hypothetical protein